MIVFVGPVLRWYSLLFPLSSPLYPVSREPRCYCRFHRADVVRQPVVGVLLVFISSPSVQHHPPPLPRLRFRLLSRPLHSVILHANSSSSSSLLQVANSIVPPPHTHRKSSMRLHVDQLLKFRFSPVCSKWPFLDYMNYGCVTENYYYDVLSSRHCRHCHCQHVFLHSSLVLWWSSVGRARAVVLHLL